jgi:hypothetical protein
METVQTQRGTSDFEEIWAILRETAARQKESDRRHEQQYEQQKKESREQSERQAKEKAELWREVAEQRKEIDKHLDKLFGKWGNQLGEIIEHMVKPNLIPKFREMGFDFDKVSPQAVIEDRVNNVFMEIDVTLENGDKVMIVEVKSKPTTEDIADHVERMAKVKAHAELHGDRRKFLGAVAGMVFNDNEKAFAMKNGFFVIEPSRGEPSPIGSVEVTGETFNITPPDGQPKEW